MTVGLLLKIIVGVGLLGFSIGVVGNIWLWFYPYRITWGNITSYQGKKENYRDVIVTISQALLFISLASFIVIVATTRFTPKEIVEFKEELNYQQLVKFLDNGNYVISDKVDVPTRISIEVETRNILFKISEIEVDKDDYVAIPKGDE